MKKILATIICAVILLSSVSLSGCDLLDELIYTNEDAAEIVVERVMTAIQKKDKDGFLALFAQSGKKGVDDLDESVDELFDYYDGTYTSYNSQLGSGSDSYGDVRIKWWSIGVYIDTATTEYTISMRWCDIDSTNYANVGLWQFYIFSAEDNPLDSYKFYPEGDIEQAPCGLYVIKPYKHVPMLMEIVQKRDAELLKSQFAANALPSNEVFASSVTALNSYYNEQFKYCLLVENEDEVEKDASGNIIKRYRRYSYGLITERGTYHVAIRYCDISADEDEIGLHSLYILKETDGEMGLPYWGDGLWNDGIYVAVNGEVVA